METSRYRTLARLAHARAHGHTAAEPLDLLHDLLVSLLERGAGLPPDAWVRGALRRRAAFLARSEGRQRSRQARFEALREGDGPPRRWRWDPALLASLPPALRQLALLIAADLSRAEIASLLGIRDDALRQRLTALRRRLRAWEAPRLPDPAPPAPLATGPIRRKLVELRDLPGFRLGTHDPDGHLLVFSTAASRIDARRQGGEGAACVRPRGASDEDQERCGHFHGGEPRSDAALLRRRPGHRSRAPRGIPLGGDQRRGRARLLRG